MIHNLESLVLGVLLGLLLSLGLIALDGGVCWPEGDLSIARCEDNTQYTTSTCRTDYECECAENRE